MHGFRCTAILLSVGLAAATMGASASATAEPGTRVHVAAPSEPVAGSPNEDTERLAEALGVDVSFLQGQIDLQDAMDTMPFATLDPGYAEDGSSNLGSDDFYLWYRSAREPGEELLQAMEDAGVLDHVRFVRVPLSLEALTDRAMETYDALSGLDNPVGVTIDTASGGVILHPPRGWTIDPKARDGDQARLSREAAAAAQKRELPVTWGDPPPVPANYGGKNVSAANGACTGGFSVVKNGDRRMSTAGHCSNNLIGASITYGGSSGFSVKTRSYSRSNDNLTFDRSGASWTAKVKFYGSGITRPIKKRRTRSQMDVGDPVAKYGRTTSYTFGYIRSKNACSPAGCLPGGGGEFIRVEKESETWMCKPGDSGGPFMYGQTAYGLTSGYFDSGTFKGDCVFLPQGKIWGKVLLQ